MEMYIQKILHIFFELYLFCFCLLLVLHATGLMNESVISTDGLCCTGVDLTLGKKEIPEICWSEVTVVSSAVVDDVVSFGMG